MRCSCIKCGAYMVQDEKGLESRCICPECFNVCSACMGGGDQPLRPSELAAAYRSREDADRENEQED